MRYSQIVYKFFIFSLIGFFAFTSPAWAKSSNNQNGKNKSKEHISKEYNHPSSKKNSNQQNPYNKEPLKEKKVHENSQGNQDKSRIQHGERKYYFTNHQKSILHSYYAQEYKRGNCPPGLLKKGNGCMPPGQAAKWRMGYPLPRGIVYYDLPPALLIQLGTPPAGYKFVRVAQDILLISIGSRMVVDSINDLNWVFD